MRKSCSLPGMPLCLLLLLALVGTSSVQSQVHRQKEIRNVNISPQIHQYLEYLPIGYSDPANATRKYPLIIYWHGLYEATSYTGGGMDALYTKGLPQKIESSVFPESVTYNGVQYSYIVITPQYTDGSAGAWDVDATITYMLSKYRIDASRIYMTGISKGAGMCFGYPNASLEFAKKVAAIAPLAACEALSWGGATNVVNAKMHIWALHCPQDNICNAATSSGS
ncbi:MAG TPA: hypothetical protein VEB42_06695, partial [Chitinophagaceae bacterium]|nr:hypothetical protein [Chitinophagaceae bacterium]